MARVLDVIFGLLIAYAFMYLPMVGYYSVACTQGGASWAFLSLLFLPLAAPALAVLVFGAGFALGLLGKPLRSGSGFWSWGKWLPVAAVVCGVLSWAFATGTEAQARCNLGF